MTFQRSTLLSVVALGAGLALAACTTTTTQTFETDAPATGDAEADGAATPPGQDGEPHDVAALLRKAGDEQDAGQLAAAVTTLQGARELDPENAQIWQRLAQARLQQGEHEKAETLALRSTELAGEDNLMKYLNWQIVAEARRQRGDERGARQADQQARSLGS